MWLRNTIYYRWHTKRELDPLSFKLLEYFIQNNERIITRQELIEQFWQKGFVDDNAINRAISDLRKTLKSELEPGLAINNHVQLAADEIGICLAKDTGLVYELKLDSSPELNLLVDLSEKIDKPIQLYSIRAQKGNLLFGSPSESNNEILSLTSKP